MRSPLDLWSPVEVRRSIGASRSAVFEVLAEPRTYPDWLVGAQQIRHVDPAFPAPGTEFHHSVGPAEDATVDDSTESVAVEADRRLVLEVRAGPVRGEVEFSLHPGASEQSTEVVMREVPIGAGRLATPVVRPILAARNRESLRRLAARLEPEA